MLRLAQHDTCDRSLKCGRAPHGVRPEYSGGFRALVSCFHAAALVGAPSFSRRRTLGVLPPNPRHLSLSAIAWLQARRPADGRRGACLLVRFMPLVQSGKCPKRGRSPAAPAAPNTVRPPPNAGRTPRGHFPKSSLTDHERGMIIHAGLGSPTPCIALGSPFARVAELADALL